MDDKTENNTKQPVTIKVSRLAIIAINLALCGLMFAFFGILSPAQRTQSPLSSMKGFFFFLSLITLVISLILGFVSFIEIEKKGGIKTGITFAKGAILISLLGVFLPVGMFFFLNVRNTAFRLVCGTHLSVFGMCMNIYTNDFDDKLPQAGGKDSTWGTSINWDDPNRLDAYRLNPDGTGGTVTISSSLYLLFKYTGEVRPKDFICNGDLKVSEFKPSGTRKTFSYYFKFWDFGPEPWKHNSYSYHMPYGQYALTTSSNPGMAVMADRNPWIPSLGWKEKEFASFNPDGDKKSIRTGNTFSHKDVGQNVLFIDGHVNFETVSFCGVNEDNIYTSWNGSDIRKGTPPVLSSQPASNTDSLLVNDPPPQKP